MLYICTWKKCLLHWFIGTLVYKIILDILLDFSDVRMHRGTGFYHRLQRTKDTKLKYMFIYWKESC